MHNPPQIEIRRATLDELTIAYRHRIQQPNLLGQIGMLCSTVRTAVHSWFCAMLCDAVLLMCTDGRTSRFSTGQNIFRRR